MAVNVDPEALAASLRRLGTVDEHDITRSLDRVIGACVEMFRISGSGLMIADEQNTLRYVVASDGPGTVLEQVQSDTGEGPCVDAFVHGSVIATEDLATETRWPASREILVQHGIRSVLGVPVRLGSVTVGSLNVYHDRPHAWSNDEASALVCYSDVIATTLDAAISAQQSSELARQLQYALGHRIVVERAVGFVMARANVDPVAAFNIIRAAARAQRKRVADIAQDLLDSRSLKVLRPDRRE
jgi:GAF domain-containing protein